MSTTVVGIAWLLLAAGACASDDDDSGTASTAPSTGAATTGSDSTATTPDTPATTGDTAAQTTTGGDGDLATTMRGRFAVDISSFDPIFLANGSDLASGAILYETLIYPDIEGGEGNVNVLAETWEVADDGLSIDFTLKQGVQFHDGFGELTAEDIKFSLERAAGKLEGSEQSTIASFYTALDRVKVTGKYSGTIMMSEPSVTMVEQALPITPIYSKAAFEERGADIAQQPVGTGPYEFAENVPGDFVRFTNFADYSGASPYVPEQRFEELVFHVITEDNAAELAYEAGDLDVLVPVRAASVSRFEGLDNTEVSDFSTMVYRWIGMNVEDPALSNRTLREAIIAAIDVPSILEATSDSQDVRATALVAPNAPIGYWEDAPVHEQDLELASQLVEQVPEADRHLRFTIGDDEMSRTVAQIAQQNLEDAGLTVEIEILDAASFFVADETTRERQLFYTEFGINYREPTQELLWFTCGQVGVWNYMYWCDERYSELFQQAQTELDRDAREQMYIEMQQLWEEAAHTVWISHPTIFAAARTDTVDIVTDPTGSVLWSAVVPQ